MRNGTLFSSLGGWCDLRWSIAGSEGASEEAQEERRRAEALNKIVRDWCCPAYQHACASPRWNRWNKFLLEENSLRGLVLKYAPHHRDTRVLSHHLTDRYPQCGADEQQCEPAVHHFNQPDLTSGAVEIALSSGEIELIMSLMRIKALQKGRHQRCFRGLEGAISTWPACPRKAFWPDSCQDLINLWIPSKAYGQICFKEGSFPLEASNLPSNLKKKKKGFVSELAKPGICDLPTYILRSRSSTTPTVFATSCYEFGAEKTSLSQMKTYIYGILTLFLLISVHISLKLLLPLQLLSEHLLHGLQNLKLIWAPRWGLQLGWCDFKVRSGHLEKETGIRHRSYDYNLNEWWPI